MYHALMIPNFNFCPFIWQFCSKTNTDKLLCYLFLCYMYWCTHLCICMSFGKLLAHVTMTTPVSPNQSFGPLFLTISNVLHMFTYFYCML